MGRWMQKIQKSTDTDTTEPTKLGSVGFVASKPVLLQKISAANEPMTPQQISWLAALSSLLEVSASYLIDDGFIDHYDLEEQVNADLRNVARLIKSDPRWRH